jgi:hypothetical protein
VRQDLTSPDGIRPAPIIRLNLHRSREIDCLPRRGALPHAFSVPIRPGRSTQGVARRRSLCPGMTCRGTFGANWHDKRVSLQFQSQAHTCRQWKHTGIDGLRANSFGAIGTTGASPNPGRHRVRPPVHAQPGFYHAVGMTAHSRRSSVSDTAGDPASRAPRPRSGSQQCRLRRRADDRDPRCQRDDHAAIPPGSCRRATVYRRELSLNSRSAGHRRSGACDGWPRSQRCSRPAAIYRRTATTRKPMWS